MLAEIGSIKFERTVMATQGQGKTDLIERILQRTEKIELVLSSE